MGDSPIPAQLQGLLVDLDQLKPYSRNPRQGDVGAIVESLKVNGQYRPIVVNERTGEILAGNHTARAARELGWTQIAATFVDVDEDDAARIALIDNRANDLAGYDNAVLAELLESLGPDLSGTGFAEQDFLELLGDAGLTPGKNTEPLPLPDAPKSKRGEIFKLGDHRLMCGDSTNASDMAALTGGGLVSFCSPTRLTG